MEKKILVIDDNKLSREIYRQALENADYKVILAGDGKEGLDIVNTEKVDLVLLDLVMPGIDGFGFLNIVKSQQMTKYLPVIVLTARDSQEEIEEAKRLGALDCLVKYKIKPAELVNIIKTVLS